VARRNGMAKPVTRAELRAELAKYPTKTFLRKELAKYATKQDLEAWGHALHDSLSRKIVTEVAAQVGAQIAHFAKVIQESTRQLFIALDDKYKDLPERVARLEARND
jgi:hypothetical protein